MNDKARITITGVLPSMKEELENISDNLGEPLAVLLRPKLREFINSFPEKIRKPKPKN
jgi:hypothetical protein